MTPMAADPLNARQCAILPIAAFAAAGDLSGLDAALSEGLDAGLSISDAREVQVRATRVGADNGRRADEALARLLAAARD